MYTESIIFGGLNRLIMRKMICDRCGREIDQGFSNDYDMRPKAMCRIYGTDLRRTGGLIDSPGDLEYDLCEDCTNKLVTFLRG